MSAYGKGAPTYDSAELQRSQIVGRLKVAVGIRDRAENYLDRERWTRIVDELLDKLNEVRG